MERNFLSWEWRAPYHGEEVPFLDGKRLTMERDAPFLGETVPFPEMEAPFHGEEVSFPGADVPLLGEEASIPGREVPFLEMEAPFHDVTLPFHEMEGSISGREAFARGWGASFHVLEGFISCPEDPISRNGGSISCCGTSISRNGSAISSYGMVHLRKWKLPFHVVEGKAAFLSGKRGGGWGNAE